MIVLVHDSHFSPSSGLHYSLGKWSWYWTCAALYPCRFWMPGITLMEWPWGALVIWVYFILGLISITTFTFIRGCFNLQCSCWAMFDGHRRLWWDQPWEISEYRPSGVLRWQIKRGMGCPVTTPWVGKSLLSNQGLVRFFLKFKFSSFQSQLGSPPDLMLVWEILESWGPICSWRHPVDLSLETESIFIIVNLVPI